MEPVTLEQLYKWMNDYHFSINDMMYNDYTIEHNGDSLVITNEYNKSFTITEASITEYGNVFASNGDEILFYAPTDPRVTWD